MLHQNWFGYKRFEMFEEMYKSQSFYDVKTGCIYVVSDAPEETVNIQEIAPGSPEHIKYYKKYMYWWADEHKQELLSRWN